MPNLKSASKRLRQDKRRAERNRAARSVLRTAIRRVHEAIDSGDAKEIEQAINGADSVIGRTAIKGVIHSNRASRLKSRLRVRANRAMSDAAAK